MASRPTRVVVLACLFACACGSERAQSPQLTAAGSSAPPAAGQTAAPTTPTSGAAATGAAATGAAGAGPRSDGPRTGAAAGSGSDSDAAPPAAGNGATGAAGNPAEPAAPMAAADAGAPTPDADEPPPVACDPADMLPEATNVPIDSLENGSIVPAKGPHMPVIEHDPGLDTHTVYRPASLDGEQKFPIIVWANGGCVTDGTMFAVFLLELTSHGFVIVSDGPPNGSGMGPLETNPIPQTQALDWIFAENERPCSKFYRKLDTTKVAAMGQSCGGLMTMGVSGDERLSTVVIWNSGMFERDQMIYAGLHTPIAYFIGGPDDVAYAQAEDDFAAIERVPLFYGNLPVGHFGTYAEDNGGEFARVGIGWLKWHLYGDESETGAKMFLGADCGLCQGTMWTIQKKNME